MGVKCYPNIAAIPGHVDLAVIATPSKTVPGLVEECGKVGVDMIEIISAGFREIGQRRCEAGGGDKTNSGEVQHPNLGAELPGIHKTSHRPQRNLPWRQSRTRANRLCVTEWRARYSDIELGGERPHRFQHVRIFGFDAGPRFRRHNRLPRRGFNDKEHHPLHGEYRPCQEVHELGKGLCQNQADHSLKAGKYAAGARQQAHTPVLWRVILRLMMLPSSGWGS